MNNCQEIILAILIIIYMRYKKDERFAKNRYLPL